MFSRAASHYDLLNHLMSLRRDVAWRRRLVATLDAAPAGAVLDLATGTGDVALAISGRRVLGADFCYEMLHLARRKGGRRGTPLTLVAADALALPFADDEFDAATVAFGIRNVSDLEAGIAEMARVVRPGGRVVILEITAPRHLRRFYGMWFDRVVPLLGTVLGRDGAAYGYLPASVKRFPEPRELAGTMAAAGLGDIRWQLFAGGIVALHYGRVRA